MIWLHLGFLANEVLHIEKIIVKLGFSWKNKGFLGIWSLNKENKGLWQKIRKIRKIRARLKACTWYGGESTSRNIDKLFYTLHPCWIHHNLKENNWILLSWKHTHLQMAMKHCTKFQGYLIAHVEREVFTSYITHSTSVGSTTTWRKIIGSSCPENIHIYKWQWSFVQSFKAIWKAV